MFTVSSLFLLSALLMCIPTAISYPSCAIPSARKEWRSFSTAEKSAFVSAVKCLAQEPHNPKVGSVDPSTTPAPPLNLSSSAYDDFTYVHADGVVRNHATGVFLAWHRWFLHTFETKLKTTCGFEGTIPYWDWSLDVSNFSAAPVFSSNPQSGLGASDGTFGEEIRAYPTPHVPPRNFTLTPFTVQLLPFPFPDPNKPGAYSINGTVVNALISGHVGNYTAFQYGMNGVGGEGMHGAVHSMVGGDMGNLAFSPNDVLFWLHHGNLDRIWALWQSRHTSNARAIGGGLTQNLAQFDEFPVGQPPAVTIDTKFPTGGLTDEDGVALEDVLSTTGGYLCYTYSKGTGAL